MLTKRKKMVFWIILVLFVLISVEAVLRLVYFAKHRVFKKSGTEWMYTPYEKELVDIYEERHRAAQRFGEFVHFSPEFYILEKGKYYKPKPDSSVVVLINDRVEHMSLVLDDKVKELVGHFEGEKYYENYDHLSLRKTGKDAAAGIDNQISILMLGDSFTNGCYVDDEDTFSAHIERYAAEDGMDVDVLNAGVNGYSTKEEYHRFVDLLPYVNVDMLILNYFPNDTNVVEHKVVGYWETKDPQTELGLWFFRHIMIAKEIMKGYYSLFSKSPDPRNNKKLQAGWKESLRYLGWIKEVCDREGMLFFIAAIPPKEQFEYGNKEFYQERLRRFCEENNIVFLDPYEYLEANEPASLYLSWDPHFTKQGNGIYGYFIYSQIKPYI